MSLVDEENIQDCVQCLVMTRIEYKGYVAHVQRRQSIFRWREGKGGNETAYQGDVGVRHC